ncbi:MAG: translation initiation factor IF-3, partial [Calditrichota bacterium]
MSKNPRVNEEIHASPVRLIGADGKQVGVIPVREAKSMAEDAGLDLVEIAPQANPPVCKIIDYGKYRYEITKKEKDARKKQHVILVKKIRLTPNI